MACRTTLFFAVHVKCYWRRAAPPMREPGKNRRLGTLAQSMPVTCTRRPVSASTAFSIAPAPHACWMPCAAQGWVCCDAASAPQVWTKGVAACTKPVNKELTTQLFHSPVHRGRHDESMLGACQRLITVEEHHPRRVWISLCLRHQALLSVICPSQNPRRAKLSSPTVLSFPFCDLASL